MNPKVDWFFEKETAWKAAYGKLREILLECEVREELKWGCPCYTVGGKNVVLIHGFQEYCALLFHKGALLRDEERLLVQQTENVQAARQMRFRGVEEVEKRARVVRRYVEEAVELERAGVKVALKKTAEFAVPEEFAVKLKEMPELRVAFEKLTPGRQRGYLLYFGGAKQSKTRGERVEKCVERILEGRGLED